MKGLKNEAEPLAKKELPAEGMVNGKKIRSRRYQMIDNIMINGLMQIRKGRLRRG